MNGNSPPLNVYWSNQFLKGSIMNVKTFLTLAAVANLFYGIWYFFSPQGAANVYGFGTITTPLSNLLLQFMGTLFLAEGVMCAIARNADRSLARNAVLAFVAVSSLLCTYLDIGTVMGEPGTMDYIDMTVNALFGSGAVYFMWQDRTPALPH
jgi:hypothetical protein